MTLELFFAFSLLNLLSLSLEKQAEIIENLGLTMIKVVEISKYRKNNDKYLNRAKLQQQVVSKALPIVKALYSGYSLVFLFDILISHFVMSKTYYI